MEKLNVWLSVLANLGVVVGIGFLIVEVRQNTEALRADTHLGIFEGAQQELFVTLEHPDIITLAADGGESASFEDYARLDAFLTAAMNARQYAWRQYQSGVIDEVTWDGEQNVIALLVGSRTTRIWWRELGSTQFAGPFAEIVEEIMAESPRHPYWERLRAFPEIVERAE